MNILWLTQTALTEARQLMNKKTNPFVVLYALSDLLIMVFSHG
ncbi:MAG: hypothetical protein PHU36_08175 [Syntrophomonadaceae bacterium]|nr:hypothetical protein [Syntrophomonadaceae bacterium]